MSDGAHAGIGAEDAMKAIIGGEPITKVESAQAMRDRILATTPEDATSYDGVATYTAKLILEFLLADPRRASIPAENVYEVGPDGRLVFNTEGGLNLVTPGLYEVMKAYDVPLDQLGLSGFMWGWAVNAARRCVELPLVSNPALLTIEIEEQR